jgi:hypothetical protein
LCSKHFSFSFHCLFFPVKYTVLSEMWFINKARFGFIRYLCQTCLYPVFLTLVLPCVDSLPCLSMCCLPISALPVYLCSTGLCDVFLSLPYMSMWCLSISALPVYVMSFYLCPTYLCAVFLSLPYLSMCCLSISALPVYVPSFYVPSFYLSLWSSQAFLSTLLMYSSLIAETPSICFQSGCMS